MYETHIQSHKSAFKLKGISHQSYVSWVTGFCNPILQDYSKEIVMVEGSFHNITTQILSMVLLLHVHVSSPSPWPQVQARQAQQTAARLAEANSNCTFKPVVSERSQRIAQGLGTDFLTRQQRHLAKKEKIVSCMHR